MRDTLRPVLPNRWYTIPLVVVFSADTIAVGAADGADAIVDITVADGETKFAVCI
jgi:hypothetical protein